MGVEIERYMLSLMCNATSGLERAGGGVGKTAREEGQGEKACVAREIDR